LIGPIHAMEIDWPVLQSKPLTARKVARL
jgi:hypothetical protein